MFGFLKQTQGKAAANPAAVAQPQRVSAIVSKTPITNEAELFQQVSFDRALADEISLSPTLLQHICPLETAKGSRKVIILVSSRHRNSEELRETIRLLAAKRFNLDDGFGRSNVFVVSNEPLIHAVARGQIDGKTAGRMRAVHGDASKSSYFQSFQDIIAYGVVNKASDVHLNIFSRRERSEVRYTIDGKYVAPDRFKLPTATLEAIARVAWQRSDGGNGAEFNLRVEQQCQIYLQLPELGEYMLRWASMACDDGPQVTMRITRVDQGFKPMGLAELGYLPSQIEMFQRAMRSEGGAIVFSGVVNSGKSTSLTSLLSQIPPTRKVVSIEDPRENILPGTHFHQNTVTRELDSDADPFKPKVRTIKRTALTDLFIGEIRDAQTGALLQDIIEAGSNCYTTVHARNCVGIPARLSSPAIGIGRDVLATPGNLKLLIYQALLPVTCQHCRLPAASLWSADAEDAAYWHAYFERIERLYGIHHSLIFVRNPHGCEHCRRSGLPELNGLKGRTVVAEMVEPDDHFNACVLDAKVVELTRYVESLRTAAFDDPDMRGKSAMECAIYKASQGLIDPREIEPRFKAFATVELEREQQKRARQREARSLKLVGGEA
ncbi:secretion system protein E [Corticibacter populi]|uniref:Secretion system protein E n=1 Tax=Corticibacter populi TaxID=1550736 RepID=A0A3M6QYS0_9BURK|nr:ATPase, T2SS/T4P/T4SS family [Corticibacter populi]RMX08160.1 secretion system protein E [Corticibacter populi]RZS35421.1 type II secretory ATPase GspE/PulE/Tfp pilus assembly ATPase PilB-like protein [Corticibacter populi]